jgi:hypothetical protein
MSCGEQQAFAGQQVEASAEGALEREIRALAARVAADQVRAAQRVGNLEALTWQELAERLLRGLADRRRKLSRSKRGDFWRWVCGAAGLSESYAIRVCHAAGLSALTGEDSRPVRGR